MRKYLLIAMAVLAMACGDGNVPHVANHENRPAATTPTVRPDLGKAYRACLSEAKLNLRREHGRQYDRNIGEAAAEAACFAIKPR